MALSCGGKGSNLNPGNTTSVNPGGAQSDVSEAVRIITEDEIASLPQWQQDLLNDPGWDQPEIAPRKATPMPAPTHEMLLEAFAADQARASEPLAPRGAPADDAKGASWNDPQTWPGGIVTAQGEYAALHSGNPPFGCKGPGTANGHSLERNIMAQPPIAGTVPVSYAVEGRTEAAIPFNTSGGAGNDAFSAVYQLFSSQLAVNPRHTLQQMMAANGGQLPLMAEISYRGDGGAGMSGPCDANARAFTVREFFWFRFNSTTSATPGGNTTPLWNLLVAPSSDQSVPDDSEHASGNTTGRIQHFYMGSLSQCYGGGAIVGLSGTTSSCVNFAPLVNNTSAPARYSWHNPIYGVLLARWQASVVKSMAPGEDNPWNTDFGWPVTSPVAHRNGTSTLTGQGAYYAWGIYFERGFIWWVDYASNVNVPDEAQAYSYTGGNVFCRAQTDRYDQLPTIFYGGNGQLGVSVTVEASLNPERQDGAPAGSYYEVGIADPLLPPVIDMHAQGYGGTPQTGTCRYKHYTWAFRDGSIGLTNSTPFSDSTKYVQKAYGEQSVYTVRVQVVDANDNIAYGDSLPVHVGSGGAGGGANAEVWLIRADGGTYNTNATALKDALTTLGTPFAEVDLSGTTATEFAASTAKVAIFYRGGPGAATEAQLLTPASQELYDQMRTILNSGSKRKVLFVSQSHQWNSTFWGNQIPVRSFGGQQIQTITGNSVELGQKIEGWHFPGTNGGWNNGISTNDIAPQGFDSSWSGNFGQFSTSAAERNSLAGSSGKVPITVQVGKRQLTTRLFFQPGFPAQDRNPNLSLGIVANAAGDWFGEYMPVSFGTPTGPGTTVGTGKFWEWSFSFADLSITASNPGGMTKAELLRNTLAWLDSGLTFAAKTNDGFSEYDGTPEILAVTPAFWDETNYQYRAGAPSATTGFGNTIVNGNYPDPTSPDVYRTSANPALDNAIITTDPNNNWLNANDVDFQFPFYAYINAGGNATVEWGPGDANTTDDTVFYGGLLVRDTDNSWDRVNPPSPGDFPSILHFEDDNNVLDRSPMPVVAGYYEGTNSGDEVFSNYGTGMESFEANTYQWSNQSRLTVETLARWPQSLRYFDFGGNTPQDATLFWALYPGQNMTVPTGPEQGRIIGLNIDWDAYRRSFDIDPSHAVAGRSGSRWNRPSFSFTNTSNNGRVVEFNMRSVNSWNPDLNRDGVRDTADKFPLRVRLFTNHQTYFNKTQSGASTWPNQLWDPGLSPTQQADPALRNASFIEGGAFVVDHGDAVYPLDAQLPDPSLYPGEIGTLYGGPGAYTVDLHFKLRFGTAPYNVQLNTDYTGDFNLTPYGVVSVGQVPNNGDVMINAPIPPTQPDGPYTFAIRVTDSSVPAETKILVYPNTVQLAPQMQIVILQDPNGALVGGVNRAVQNVQSDVNTLFPGAAVIRNLGTNPLTPGSLDNADAIIWASDIPTVWISFGFWQPFAPYPQAPFGFTMGTGNQNATEVINQVVNNGKTFVVMGSGAFSFMHPSGYGNIFASTTQPSIMAMNSTNLFFGQGPQDHTYDHPFFGSLQNVPNNVWGFDAWQATTLSPPFPCQMMGFGTLFPNIQHNIEGWVNQIQFQSYSAGQRRLFIGANGGKTQTFMSNYGDFGATQGATRGNSKQRYQLLENMLCGGDFSSKFNSNVTP